MAKTRAAGDSLKRLFEQSGRPIYAIDRERQIVFCNEALATWLGLEPGRIVGRLVEYHSEPAKEDHSDGDSAGALTGLCPPPLALAGEKLRGTVSCVARDGRLVHRHADFVPLDVSIPQTGETKSRKSTAMNHTSVLVILDAADLSPHELAAELGDDPTADELHRTIRRFRRAVSAQYSLDSLLGGSSYIRKARAQAGAAAASGANLLVVGRRGTGRSHVARAVHYRGATDSTVKLVPVDCEALSDDLLRRAFESLRNAPGSPKHRSTLLLQNLEHLSPTYQAELLDAIRRTTFSARVAATISDLEATPNIDPALLDAISTITIHLPRLKERIEDLPILSQCFLEASNRGRGKQVGSIRADALDLLALYDWPRELDELQEVMAAAHRVCESHEIIPADLPEIIHHARKTASLLRAKTERIVLDELLGAIEKEVIGRALAQAGGNKTEAASLLGMTRPRLYRRLVQLDMITESPAEAEMPEFEPQPDLPEQSP